MTEATSVEPKPTSLAKSEEFPDVIDWRLSLAKGDHIAKYQNIILETMLSSIPPQNRESPILRANLSGAIVDGRIQVWQILGKVKETGEWRPVGYGTTSIRPDELSQEKTLLIYTLFSYGVIANSAYQHFWDVWSSYAKDQGCVKVALFTQNARVLKMTKSVGMDTSWHFVFRYVE